MSISKGPYVVAPAEVDFFGRDLSCAEEVAGEPVSREESRVGSGVEMGLYD
jgi:hypothetical protein